MGCNDNDLKCISITFLGSFLFCFTNLCFISSITLDSLQACLRISQGEGADANGETMPRFLNILDQLCFDSFYDGLVRNFTREESVSNIDRYKVWGYINAKYLNVGEEL